MKKGVLLLFVLFSSSALAEPYVRFAIGGEQGVATSVVDRDCSNAQPPALFGCGFHARGDFGRALVIEAAGGMSLGRTRVELALAQRDLRLDAQANFTGVSGPQPVFADGTSRSAMVIGAMELGPLFVLAGAGMARNEIGAVTYSFPSIAPNAATIVRGGEHDAFAWTVGAGTTLPLSETLDLDVALRYTDLGDVRTDAGTATIVRPTRTFELDIDGTRAPLQTLGLTLSLRWRID